jgi:glutathione S-transferase
VWLALEHKALPYELKMMSFTSGDLATPEYTEINPRRKVPAIVDEGFALYESAAILDYLEDAYPGAGRPLYPRNRSRGAGARPDLAKRTNILPSRWRDGLRNSFKPTSEWNPEVIAEARASFGNELAHLSASLPTIFRRRGGAVDFTVYPMVALALRLRRKTGSRDLTRSVRTLPRG